MSFANTVQVIERMVSVAKRHPSKRFAWSTGEQIAVAMVLNKPTWIKDQGYTMLTAIERLGEEWTKAALYVQRGF